LTLTRSIPLEGLTTVQATGIACETMIQLNWSVCFDESDVLTGISSADTESHDIFKINIAADQLIIVSDANPESDGHDITINAGLASFVAQFMKLKSSATTYDFAVWNDKLRLYRNISEIEPSTGMDEDESELILPGEAQHPYITYALVAINMLVFLVMIISGVNVLEPAAPDIIAWGGNFGPFTTAGEWWRLLTCMFVHVGVVHLLFNMYALLVVGIYLEPFLGKTRFLVAYLSTGLFASIASTWWHEEPAVSAGASGAVFGVYGLFLALLTTRLIPKQARMQLLQGIAIFVVYNLVMGLRSGVDNAAHIGGLLSGIVAGYMFYLAIRKEESGNRSPYPAILVLALSCLIAFVFLKRNAPVEVKDDSERFSRTMEHFGALEELALEAMHPADTVPEATYLKELKKTALTDWVECVNLFEEAEKFALPPRLKTLRADMLEYSKHRVQQTLMVIKAAEGKTERYKPGIDSIEEQIRLVIEKVREGSSPTQEL
jgi:rhomboid protease GluP